MGYGFATEKERTPRQDTTETHLINQESVISVLSVTSVAFIVNLFSNVSYNNLGSFRNGEPLITLMGADTERISHRERENSENRPKPNLPTATAIPVSVPSVLSVAIKLPANAMPIQQYFLNNVARYCHNWLSGNIFCWPRYYPPAIGCENPSIIAAGLSN